MAKKLNRKTRFAKILISTKSLNFQFVYFQAAPIEQHQKKEIIKKPIKIKQETEIVHTPQPQVITVPSNHPQQIKITADHPQLTAAQLTQPIQIQMSQAGQVQPQILQIPIQSIVSSAQNQITYNQTTTQSTKTTYFKTVGSADGNVYQIPSNLILHNPTFMTTASGELQVGAFKIENN